MEDAYIIHGGNTLKGVVSVSGAKNVSLKAIIASLMMSNKVILRNVPRIKDVFELLGLIQNLGGKANFIGKNTVGRDGSGINTNKVDFLYASKIRVSFMMAVPLLYKFGEAYVPNPGGCRIGARPIDRIIKGMESLGINVEYDSKSGYYHLKMKSPPKGEYSFTKSSHTGTETLIILSVFSKGKVLIKNTALEPEIDELIKFLNQA